MIYLLTALILFLMPGCKEATPAVQPSPPIVQTPALLPTQIPRSVLKYRNGLIREVRYHWGLNQSPSVFFAQVHQESAWRADAHSAYAAGLTQFTPDTAEWIQSLYPADLTEFCANRSGCPLDAGWAIRAMVLYDRRLWDGFAHSIDDHRWAFALASYNGGLGWIQRERAQAQKRHIDPEFWFGAVEAVCLRAQWACAENRQYPRRILFVWRPVYEGWLS